MPPKVQPKTYILPVKTHKLTFFITASQTSTISSLKPEVLSALTAPVLLSPPPPETALNLGIDPDAMELDNPEWEVPRVESVDEFELCRAVKDKGRLTGRYEMLQGNMAVKSALVNWEMVFVQFKDKDSGKLQPVKVSVPSLLEDDEDEQPPAPEPQPTASSSAADASSSRKGKRKARPDSPTSDFLDD